MFKLKNIICILYNSKYMLLPDLPDELLYVVLSMDRKPTSLRSIRCRMAVLRHGAYSQRLLLRISTTRIQLWYKIFSRFHKQRHLIEKSVAWMFSLKPSSLFSGVSGHRPFSRCVERMPYMCAYYAPVVPNGRCRGCTRFRDTHPFSEWVVCQCLGMG